MLETTQLLALLTDADRESSMCIHSTEAGVLADVVQHWPQGGTRPIYVDLSTAALSEDDFVDVFCQRTVEALLASGASPRPSSHPLPASIILYQLLGDTRPVLVLDGLIASLFRCHDYARGGALLNFLKSCIEQDLCQCILGGASDEIYQMLRIYPVLDRYQHITVQGTTVTSLLI